MQFFHQYQKLWTILIFITLLSMVLLPLISLFAR